MKKALLSLVTLIAFSPAIGRAQTKSDNTEVVSVPTCDFGAGTLPEGSEVMLSVDTETPDDSSPVELTISVNQPIGVVNNGPGNPPASPPSAKNDYTWLYIMDLTDGSEVFNNSIYGAALSNSPFSNGCYRFIANAFGYKKLDLKAGHSYLIETEARWTVTRYYQNGNDWSESTTDLAWAFDSTTYFH